ncbi:hypothetical protein UY3_02477 [Chelonia mydas]|uniref:Uncharacterized protein n=1 Tax=Chelonia mydas TaxID=8469 RepID=M7BT11_CHEMY|nr:hypothetical protein UY3_02477 [Chelonia mydas]
MRASTHVHFNLKCLGLMLAPPTGVNFTPCEKQPQVLNGETDCDSKILDFTPFGELSPIAITRLHEHFTEAQYSCATVSVQLCHCMLVSEDMALAGLGSKEAICTCPGPRNMKGVGSTFSLSHNVKRLADGDILQERNILYPGGYCSILSPQTDAFLIQTQDLIKKYPLPTAPLYTEHNSDSGHSVIHKMGNVGLLYHFFGDQRHTYDLIPMQSPQPLQFHHQMQGPYRPGPTNSKRHQTLPKQQMQKLRK